MEKNRFLKEYFDSGLLEIPLYQRYYEWKAENCNRLFDDLINAANATGNQKNHFFGSIITLIDQESKKTAVIDGQQRITTIALLLAAIRDVLSDPKSGIVSSDQKLSSKIDRLLKDQDDDHIYLVHVDKDKAPYESIIYNEHDEKHDFTNIVINYNLFVKSLKKNIPSKTTIDLFYEAITNLYVMPIRLTHEDDAQAVFESINSTGLDLKESDKIRNFILMNHPVEYQNKYYTKYWLEIEKNASDISAFFRHYVIATSSIIPNLSKVYESFKKLFKSRLSSEEGEYEDLFEKNLKEVMEYSSYYRMIVNHDFGPKMLAANIYMHHINRLDVKQTYPLFLCVVKDWKAGVISDDEFTEIIRIQHNVLVRRAVCGFNSSGINSYYYNLYRTISNLNSDDPIVEKFKYLAINRDTIRYPSDEEVVYSLDNLDLYRGANVHVAGVVLATIESINRETGDIMSRMETKPPSVSIEHIMPQDVTEPWRCEIGIEEYDAVRQQYLHKIGNLTLTGYNSELSNNPFTYKKEMEKGFNDSPLFLNASVKCEEHWNKESILRRQKIMTDEFLKVLPEITTNCTVRESEDLKMISVDNDPSTFTSFNVKGYIFCRRKIECPNGMAEVLCNLVSVLMTEDANRMYKIATDGTVGQMINATGYPEDRTQEVCINNSVYVHTRSSNYDKAVLISDLLDQFDIDRSEVIIFGYGYKSRPKRNKDNAKQTTLMD